MVKQIMRDPLFAAKAELAMEEDKQVIKDLTDTEDLACFAVALKQ